jgi:predicted RNase H-like HicB family nuclease
MATLLENESGSINFVFDEVEWLKRFAYRCHICVIPDEDGQFSAVVLNLPGAGSCGRTEEEALTNVQDAVRGVIESYTMDGEAVPWQDSEMDDIPEGAKLMWILVNAQ